MVKKGKLKINFTLFGVLLLVVFTVVNTSQYGASLSWVLIPCFFISIGVLKKRTVTRASLLIILFWGGFVCSTLFSEYVYIQRDIVTFAIFCIVYIIAVSYPYSVEQVKMINNIYIIVSSICSLNILYNWVSHNYYNEWFHRASFQFMGIYKDPNYVMAFIVPAMYLTFVRIMNEKKKRYILIEILMLSNFITTGSRGAIICFLVSIFIMLLVKSKMNLQQKIKVCTVIGIIIIIGSTILTRVLPVQAIERIVNSGSDSRIDLWRSALEVFYKHPILGGGMGAASKESLRSVGNYSHNVYIDILVNGGMAGVIFFLIFFYYNCCRTQKKYASFMLGAIIAFMFPLFFINGFNSATFYFPLIILTIYSRLCRIPNFQMKNVLFMEG
ncbi:MAG: O-antigen ligase family protein [Clostridiales bacterium]|nr:O-antigen ligase family protein [Clostridiales bacterium]